jgi:hypothetical protein
MWRRSVVQGLGILPAALSWPALAEATLVAGLTLRQMVGRSRHVVVLRAEESVSRRVRLGGRDCIVTDTRARVQGVLLGAEPPPTITVRTLGGRVGSQGELVLGQAMLSKESDDVAFLTAEPEGLHWFVGMAQGHYPLRGGGAEPVLQHSKSLPEIQHLQTSAVKALHGLTLSSARRSIREAGRR